MDCIFCQIIQGKIPAHKVYEDDDCLAFLDIAPVNKGHVLVIPKKHFLNLEEIDEVALSKLIITVKKVGQSLKIGLGVKGYNVQLNNGKVAGQVIGHIHFHVIPRFPQDGLKLWPQGKYKEGEPRKILEKIKNNFK